MASSSSDASKELTTEAEIVERFNELRKGVQVFIQKIGEMESDKTEHQIVIDAISPLEATRKCFRLVGGVLVQRTVSEVLPAVTKNRDQLVETIARLREGLENQQQQLISHQMKYKIKINA